jgi:hypothetical protein
MTPEKAYEHGLMTEDEKLAADESIVAHRTIRFLIGFVQRMLQDKLGLEVSAGLAEWDDGRIEITFTPRKATEAHVS